MKVYKDISIEDFDAWSGAVDTKGKIVDAGKEEAFNEWVEETYPDGIDATELNNILCFEAEQVYVAIGLDEDGNVPSDNEDGEPIAGDECRVDGVLYVLRELTDDEENHPTRGACSFCAENTDGNCNSLGACGNFIWDAKKGGGEDEA